MERARENTHLYINNVAKISIETTVQASIEHVWECWTLPEHITKWCFASNDWRAHCTENDIRTGGHFLTHMAAKDGSQSFDFSGMYTEVIPHKKISYRMDDDREVVINFSQTTNGVHIAETFDAENENNEELQRTGWQSILNNFKTYAELG